MINSVNGDGVDQLLAQISDVDLFHGVQYVGDQLAGDGVDQLLAQISDVDLFHGVQYVGDQHAATNSIYNLQQLNSEQRTHTESEQLFLDLQKTAADKGFDIDNNWASGESVFDVLSQQLRRVKGIKNSHEQIRQELVQFLQNFPNRLHGTELFNSVYESALGSDYLESKEEDGTLNDQEILHAAANRYKAIIRVINSHGSDVMISPNDPGVVNTNPLVVGLIREKHYASLRLKRGMGEYRKNVYLLTKKEETTLTLSQIKGLRKKQRYQRGVTFFENMKDDDVRILLENQFSPILSNKRFSCATREGQANNQYNFDNERRVWDGRTIKRKVKGGSALYLILEDEVSLTQAPQSATIVTSMNTTNSTENAVETTTQREQDMNTNIPGLHVSLTQKPLSATTVPSMNTTYSTENAAERLTQLEQNMLTNNPGMLVQNEIPSISTDTFQSGDSAFSSSEETVSRNGIFGQSDSGISYEAGVCLPQAPKPPRSKIQEAKMEPTEGPLQGGGLFQAEIDEKLPPSMETGRAIFGKKSVKVRVSRDGLVLFGKKIPPGDKPGPVTVIFTTLKGKRVAKGTYTYKESENPKSRQSTSVKRAFDELEESVKRFKREVGLCDESDEIAAENYHETDGEASGPVTVTFSTVNGECVAKETYTYKKRENPTTRKITCVKRSLDDIEEHIKRISGVVYSCCGSDEFAAENCNESGGDAPEPVIVTFTTLSGECVAKGTYTYKESENPTIWQITRVKQAFDEFEDCVKRLKRETGLCDERDEFVAENYHVTDECFCRPCQLSGVTQVVKAQLAEEGYLGDTETSDTEDKDSDLVDNNENEIEEGESFVSLDPRHPSTESVEGSHLALLFQSIGITGLYGAIAEKFKNAWRETELTRAESLHGLLNGRRKIAIETSGTIKLNGNREGDELKKSQAFPSQRQTEIPSQAEVIIKTSREYMGAATNIRTEAAGSLYGAGDRLHLLFRQNLTHLQEQSQEKERKEANLLGVKKCKGRRPSRTIRTALPKRKQEFVNKSEKIGEMIQQFKLFQNQSLQKYNEYLTLRIKFQQLQNEVSISQRQRVEQHQEVDQMRRQKAKTTETQSRLMALRQERDLLEAENQRWRDIQRLLQIEESSHHWIISRNEVQVTDKRLGSGYWATVYEGRYCGYTVAVKQIKEEIASPYRLKMFQREIDMVSKCRHPCLLQFIGATIDVGFPLLVTELMETSLRRLLNERSLSIGEVSIISLDVARALNYLHKKQPVPMIHRDISSANVLLWRKAERETGIQEAQWRGKVSDYGTAKFVEQVTTQTPGCLAHSAPEVHTTTQTAKANVFSFGVLLCEMCIREYPEPGRRCEQVNKMSNRALQELVRQCLQTNPDDRPDMTEIISKLEQLQEVQRETCNTFKERNAVKAKQGLRRDQEWKK